MINFKKEDDSYKTDNIGQPNDDVLENTTNRSAYAAFASPRMSNLLNKWIKRVQKK